MDQQKFDGVYDAPVKKKTRRYKRAAESLSATAKPTHRVWIHPPYCAAEMVISELCAANPTDETVLPGGVRLFAQADDWLTAGGHLIVNLSELNFENNSVLVSAVSDPVVPVHYVSETNLQHWREVCLCEQSSGKTFGQLQSDPVTVPTLMHAHRAVLHVNMYSYIVSVWQQRFPGESHTVSEIWAERRWPWPHQIQWRFDDELQTWNGEGGISNMLRNANQKDHSTVDNQYLVSYFSKLPLAGQHAE